MGSKRKSRPVSPEKFGVVSADTINRIERKLRQMIAENRGDHIEPEENNQQTITHKKTRRRK
ncbi:MAG: hypothetical protein Q7T21_10385 [Gallionella sp.]|nr:hypothetical protein [Gallionella sp.]